MMGIQRLLFYLYMTGIQNRGPSEPPHLLRPLVGAHTRLPQKVLVFLTYKLKMTFWRGGHSLRPLDNLFAHVQNKAAGLR